jgi:hypothetical protein
MSNDKQRQLAIAAMYGAAREYEEAETKLRASAEALSAETGITVDAAIDKLRPSMTPQKVPGKWYFTPSKK